MMTVVGLVGLAMACLGFASERLDDDQPLWPPWRGRGR